MLELAEVDLTLKELEEGYRKKYFRKDRTKPWSFMCYHCEKKVASDEADVFWSIPVTSYDSNGMGRRFCSKGCSDRYFNEQRNELLQRRKRIMEDRRLLREFYEVAEREFKEARYTTQEPYSKVSTIVESIA